MRKRILQIPIAGTFAAVLLLAGCADENPWRNVSNEKGSISLTLDTDLDFKTSKPVFKSPEETRAGTTSRPGDLSTYIEVPTSNDFSVRVEKTDGGFSQSWDKYADFKKFAAENTFPTGAYTLTAYYGEKGKQDFNSPYFEASETFTVLAEQTREVNLTAELKNSMVKINYTDGFKNYMKDYSTKLHTEGRTDDIVFLPLEEKTAFVEPNKASLIVNFTTKDKNFTSAISLGEFPPEAKTLHNITLDVTENPNGSSTLDVKFDDTLKEENITIDLTEELLTTPAPVITCEGFASGETIDASAGTAASGKLAMTVMAKGFIEKAILTVEPADGNYRAPWGNELDLCKATATEQTLLKDSGISAVGFFNNPDMMAILDITNYTQSLKNGIYTISLTVEDKNGAVSQPATVTINCEAISLTPVETSPIAYGATEAKITLDYNGRNPERDVTFSVTNGGTESIARVISCEEETATRAFETRRYIYTLELPTPALSSKIGIKAKHTSGSEASSEATVSIPDYRISAVDAFAHYAYVKIEADASVLETITNNIRFKSADLNISERDAANGILTITGLNAKSSYGIESSITGGEIWNTEMPIETESERAIPNGDFSNSDKDQVVEILTSGSLLVGGDWYATNTTLSKPGQHHSSFSYIMPQDWSTINNVTAASENQVTNYNTWYVVPSSWLDNGRGFMRNVGYNHNGPTLADPKGTNTDHYCRDHPEDSELNKAAGVLSIGSYDFNTGTTNGIGFNSRPSFITFDYEYKLETRGQEEDRGYAYIEISDINGTPLGKTAIDLEPGSGSKTISFEYEKFGSKAQLLKIYFKSSNQSIPPIYIPTGGELSEGYDNAFDMSNKTIPDNSYHAVATGSELWIDNVTAHYGATPGGAANAPRKDRTINKSRR